MFTGYKAGPFAPGVHDISREAPKTFLPPAAGTTARSRECRDYCRALGGGDIPEPPVDAITTVRRKALAEWIASASNPLTARVMVNRIWQYHFGNGLVSTPSDFGVRGARAIAPRAARLARDRVRRQRLVDEEVASPDYAVVGVPAEHRRLRARPRSATRRTSCSRIRIAGGSVRKRSATVCCRHPAR